MSVSTGPAVAGIVLVLARDVVVNQKDWVSEYKPLAAGALLTLGLYGLEQLAPTAARAIAWLYLTSVIFVPPAGGKSPIQAIFDWYGKS